MINIAQGEHFRSLAGTKLFLVIVSLFFLAMDFEVNFLVILENISSILSDENLLDIKNSIELVLTVFAIFSPLMTGFYLSFMVMQMKRYPL